MTWKASKYGVISGPYFPVFELNTEIYVSKYGVISGLYFPAFGMNTERKMSKYGVISGPYFPSFGLNTERYFVLNTERYFVSLRIQYECGKIRTRKSSIFGHFLRSGGDLLKNVCSRIISKGIQNFFYRYIKSYGHQDKNEATSQSTSEVTMYCQNT